MIDPLLDDSADGATPLSAGEREGLIPTYITLRRELNEVEQRNIDDADRWAFARRRNVLDNQFLRQLHKRMFADVWTWAGEVRRTAKNVGIDHRQIEVELRQLVDTTRYWIEHETFPPDEIVARFHHRLTQIHPFPNGNGRFSRLAADMLSVQLGRGRPSWGQGDLRAVGGDVRRRYIEALRTADDEHDIGPLLAFVRS